MPEGLDWVALYLTMRRCFPESKAILSVLSKNYVENCKFYRFFKTLLIFHKFGKNYGKTNGKISAKLINMARSCRISSKN